MTSIKILLLYIFAILTAWIVSGGSQAFAADTQNSESADRVFIRVHVLNTNPENVPVRIGLSVLKSTFERIAALSFGSAGKVVKFDNNIKWNETADILPISPRQYSRWIEVTDIIYKKYPYKGGWIPFDNSYGQKTFVFGFYSSILKNRNATDIGNIESITASVDFATAPDENAIVKTVTYASENSCVPIYIRKPQNHLADYGKQIRSLYDYAVDRYELLKKLGMEEQPLAKRILTSARIQNGYWYPIYDRKTMAMEAKIARLLGIRSILWKLRNVSGVNTSTLQTFAPVFWEETRPEWIDPDPWTKDLAGKTLEKVGPQISGSIKHWKLTADDSVLFKMGDECRIMAPQVASLPKGLVAFRRWLEARGIKPEQIGLASLDVARPNKKSDVNDETSARLYWLSVCFRQEATINWWKHFSDEMRKIFDGRLIATTETYMGTFDDTPNFFLLDRSGAFDIGSQEYAQRLWVPAHAALYKAALYRSAAKFGKSKPGILWCSYRGLGKGVDGIMELDGTTALINGMQHIYLYGYGPKWSGWGEMDDESIKIYAEAGKIFQRATRVEDYILDGDSPLKKPQAAMLLSQSSEVWAGGAENSGGKGLLCERQMLAAALTWNQIPFDIICEFDIDKLLKNYRVLYITDTHLSSEAQKVIVKWVQNGGTLFSIADSAERNEINYPESLMEKLLPSGSKFSRTTSSQNPDYKETQRLYTVPVIDNAEWLESGKKVKFQVIGRKEQYEIPGGKILARYQDRSTAAVEFSCAKGKVIRIGTALGTVLARTMKPRFANKIIYNQRRFNENICRIYALPFREDLTLSRPIHINKMGIDAMFYENSDGAIVLLADYEFPEKDKIDLEIQFTRTYTSCHNEAGIELPIVHDGKKTVVRDVELGISEVLTFR